jgi:SET domain-containing protein
MDSNETTAYLKTSATAVRPSPIQGQGLFATTSLPGRRKLGEISGQLVKLPQARKDIEHAERIYFIELTDAWALECSNGNQFKHLNHSCAPNCFLRIIGKRVEVYTLRSISYGTELTVDYGETPHKGGMRCQCGAPKCRAIL